MRHFGIRPHQCPSCDKKFVEPGDLQKHVAARHSEERRYACPRCNWAFKDVSNLHSHCRRKHKLQLPRARYRGNPGVTGNEKQMTDSELAAALVVECVGKGSDKETTCVLCGTKFLHRGNMYTHGKKMHQRDFKKLLHAEVKHRKLPFNMKRDDAGGRGHDVGEEKMDEFDVVELEEEEQEEVIKLEGSITDCHMIVDDNSHIINASQIIDTSQLTAAIGSEYRIIVSSLETSADGEQTIAIDAAHLDTADGKIVGEISHDDLLEAVGCEIGKKSASEIATCPICKEQFMVKQMLTEHGVKDHGIDFQSLVDEWSKGQ